MLVPALAVAVRAVAIHKVESASMLKRSEGHASVVVSWKGDGRCAGVVGNGCAECSG
jgi:hypothetical protein